MRALWLLALALMLAGCSDAASPGAEGPAGGPTAKEVTTGKTTGAISGVIVDLAVVPIAGADVSIASLGINASTDADGSFVFLDMEPGNYFLNVAAAGYSPVQVSVAVEAGQVAKPRVQLEQVTVIEAVHYTLKHDGYIQFSGAVSGPILNIILQDLMGDNPLCHCTMAFSTAEDDMRTLVVEAIWTDSFTSPTGPSDLYLEVFPEDLDDGTSDIKGGFLTSPIFRHYQVEEWGEDENNVEWQARLSGGGYSVQYDQSYELFVTVFSNLPAPADWSFIQGDR